MYDFEDTENDALEVEILENLRVRRTQRHDGEQIFPFFHVPLDRPNRPNRPDRPGRTRRDRPMNYLRHRIMELEDIAREIPDKIPGIFHLAMEADLETVTESGSGSRDRTVVTYTARRPSTSNNPGTIKKYRRKLNQSHECSGEIPDIIYQSVKTDIESGFDAYENGVLQPEEACSMSNDSPREGNIIKKMVNENEEASGEAKEEVQNILNDGYESTSERDKIRPNIQTPMFKKVSNKINFLVKYDNINDMKQRKKKYFEKFFAPILKRNSNETPSQDISE